MEFKLEDGAYRITENQKKQLKEFLIQKIEKDNIRTKTGNLSKGKNFPAVYIDGVKKIFKHKGKPGWSFSDTAGLSKYAKNRQNKLRQVDPASKVKSTQLEADTRLHSMFTDTDHGIEHSSRAHDFHETNKRVGHAADDIHNKLPSPVEDMKIKNGLEAMTDSWKNPWHVVSDNATGKPRIVNFSQFNEFDPDDAGVVIKSMKEYQAIRESLKTGKLVKGADPEKVKYLLSERIPINGNGNGNGNGVNGKNGQKLDDLLKQFKAYGKDQTVSIVQKVANNHKARKIAGKGLRLAAGVGTVAVLANTTGRVHAAVRKPNAKNLKLAGLGLLDAGLEATEYLTGGLSLPLTTLLQAGIIGAEIAIENDGQPKKKNSFADRRRYRH